MLLPLSPALITGQKRVKNAQGIEFTSALYKWISFIHSHIFLVCGVLFFFGVVWCGQVIFEMFSALCFCFCRGTWLWFSSGSYGSLGCPFLCQPKDLCPGRRRQAFTFGICMCCMNFLQFPSEWCETPTYVPVSPPIRKKSVLCLYLCRDLSVI